MSAARPARRVLVTGATGFVGSHTTRALLRAGHDVRVLVRRPEQLPSIFGRDLAGRLDVVTGDMTDASAVGRALAGQDAVVHAAALVRLERRHAARVLEGNRAGVEHVVGGAVARGIERILYVSSAVALFQPGGPAITRDSPVGTGENAYMRSKAECERHVRELQARGAPIRTSYPVAVLGPDDPGLSAANRALLALFRDVAVVTRGGLQMVDVRDVARAHVHLLGLPAASGRHILAGHFLRWGELVDRFEQLTGRRFRRVHAPAALLAAAGSVCDAIKRVWDFELPLTREAARIMTEWVPVVADGEDEGERPPGLGFRDVRATLRDTLLWLHDTRALPARTLGSLQSYPMAETP